MRSDLLCTKEINAAQPNLEKLFTKEGLVLGGGNWDSDAPNKLKL